MAKTRLILLAATTAVMLALPGVGGAQSTPGDHSDSNAAVSFGGDRAELSADGYSLIGRAEVLQGDRRLRADRIDITIRNQTATSAKSSGNVYFVMSDQTIRADRADYDIESGNLVVTGNVILSQGRNVATGGRLIYNLQTGNARWDGGTNGRVEGVLYPSQR